MNSPLRGSLPFMKTPEDAIALCNQEKDNFYVSAFMIECWLGDVVTTAMETYAENKHARDRHMQADQTWHSFQGFFGQTTNPEFPRVFGCLLRFAEYDDCQAEILRRAAACLSVEHDCSGDYIGPKAPNPSLNPVEAIQLARRTVHRWCAWVDAVIHHDTHLMWHVSPAQFDPDPEKRELATLGVNERFLAHMNDFSRTWWQWHLGEAADRFKDSPKWPSLGHAMASLKDRSWRYQDADTAVITLWPLLKRHNWTYRDLLQVICKTIPPPHTYPLDREQALATYCRNVLGLHKPPGPDGKSSPNGSPPGTDVALKLFVGRPDPS